MPLEGETVDLLAQAIGSAGSSARIVAFWFVAFAIYFTFLLWLFRIAYLKGRLGLALLGLFVPLFMLVAVADLAPPDTKWAQRHYTGRKMQRAMRRFPGRGYHTELPTAQPLPQQMIDGTLESRFVGEGPARAPTPTVVAPPPPPPMAQPSAVQAPVRISSQGWGEGAGVGPEPAGWVPAGEAGSVTPLKPPAEAGVPTPPSAIPGGLPPRRPRWLPWAIGAVVVVAAGAGVLTWWLLRGATGEAFPLAGTWSGMASITHGPAIQVTVTINPYCDVGQRCGTFDIPAWPCSGTFTYMGRQSPSAPYEFHTSDLVGSCPEARDFLRLLPDGTLGYSSVPATGETTTGTLTRVTP